ncbi:MAG: NAD(P)-dependent oxidoreductase, partial [Dehalococcoidia bacterium]|nr:NAD(P)-dependent oxidoreductase [Dehalococcoidia bacterium]
GTGPIGQRVAQLARGMGMNVVAYTINPSPERAREYGVEFVELDDLLRQSDVVVTVIAVSNLTENMIGPREFGLMKPTAILVNT